MNKFKQIWQWLENNETVVRVALAVLILVEIFLSIVLLGE